MLIRLTQIAAVQLLVLGVLDQVARAEPDQWLVTVVGPTAGEGEGRKPADTVRETLRQEGREVIAPARAVTLFEQRHSKPPVNLAPTEVERLQKAFRNFSYQLALENLAESQEALDELNALAPEVADVLNSKVESAEQVFQACLVMAHVYNKFGYRDRATKQAADCVRSFPGFESRAKNYPAHIRQLYARAEVQAVAQEPATIRVDAPPSSGDECRARVNGIDWGALPARVSGVRTDEVRLQVECDGDPGRIYRARIEPGTTNELFVDTRLDRVLRTEGDIELRYAKTEQAQSHLVKDCVKVAKVVGAAHVVVVDLVAGVLRRVDVDSARQVATALDEPGALHERIDGTSVAAGVREILRVRPVPPNAVAASTPSKQRAEEGPGGSGDALSTSDTTGSGPGPGPFIVMGAGAALLIGAAATAGVAADIQSELKKQCPDFECLDTSFKSDRNTGKTLATVSQVLLVSGLVSAAAGAAWWLLWPEEDAEARLAVGCAPNGCGFVVRGRL